MPEPRFRRAAALVVVALALSGCSEQPVPRPAQPPATPAAPASPAGTPTPSSPSYVPEPFEPAAYDDWLTAVPDGTRDRLDVALPEDGGDFTRGRAGVRMELCGVPLFPSGRLVDRATVSASGPEYGEARDLRLFADDRAAHRFLARVVATVQACPEQVSGGTSWRHELRPSRLEADESVTAVRSYRDQDGLPLLGAAWWEVARVGNAVLLTATGGEYEPTTTLDAGIRRHAADVAEIVEAMCVFAADPCDRAPVPGTSTRGAVVGPHGPGGITLGDDEDEIEAIGGRVTGRRTASGCRIVDLWVNDGPDLVGNLEPGLGLSVIHVRTAGRTDRGVGIGSPFREVVAAYPGGQGDRQLYSSDVAGYDDRHWRFWFGHSGRVDGFMLLLDEQQCGG